MQIADRALAVLTVVGGAGWVLYVLAWGSDAGLTVPVLLVLTWGGVALLGLWSLRFTVYIVATKGAPEPRRLRRLVVGPALVLLCFGLVWSGLAFQVRFLVSRPALDRVAREARPMVPRGELTPGARVGLFWVKEAEVLPSGIVRIITTPCMFDDCGLVYSPGGEPPRIGEDTYRRLGGAWWHWWRSW